MNHHSGRPRSRKLSTLRLGNAVDPAVVSASTDDDGAPQGVNANRFLWTIPEIPTPKDSEYFSEGMDDAYASCTVRIRYNISTSDFPQWPEEAMPETHQWQFSMVDHRNNSASLYDDANTPPIQDPYVYVGAGDESEDDDQFVSLAVNTNQRALRAVSSKEPGRFPRRASRRRHAQHTTQQIGTAAPSRTGATASA